MGDDCCGGGSCGSHQGDAQKKDGSCCSSGTCCQDGDKKDGCCGSGNCGDHKGDDHHAHDHGDGCGCGHTHDEQELTLTADQIQKINTILGDIDDEDLETGDYDLTDEQAAELNSILFGKKTE